MRLTVDASVVVKWSVSEELAANAALLLAHRLELHAPDLVLVEFANVCWKKYRRGQLTDVTQHLEEMERLPTRVRLHPVGGLVLRGAEIAFALDHPMYDCLYLACAEGTGSQLVTADRRFANKVHASTMGIPVRYLGAEDFADEIGAAGVAPVIARTTVEALVEAYDLLAATGETGASVTRSRLVARLADLSAEERVDLLALGRFGRPAAPDWRTCHEGASAELPGADMNHLVRGAPFWRSGYERLFGPNN